MKTIIDKNTGQELFATAIEITLEDNQIAIDQLRTEPMDNPYWDFEKQIFYNNEN